MSFIKKIKKFFSNVPPETSIEEFGEEIYSGYDIITASQKTMQDIHFASIYPNAGLSPVFTPIFPQDQYFILLDQIFRQIENYSSNYPNYHDEYNRKRELEQLFYEIEVLLPELK